MQFYLAQKTVFVDTLRIVTVDQDKPTGCILDRISDRLASVAMESRFRYVTNSGKDKRMFTYKHIKRQLLQKGSQISC